MEAARGSLLTPLVTPESGDSSRHVRASLPDTRWFRHDDFYTLILTHQLWYLVPVLFAVFLSGGPSSLDVCVKGVCYTISNNSSLVAWIVVLVVASLFGGSCLGSYSDWMAVVAKSSGAHDPKGTFYSPAHIGYLLTTPGLLGYVPYHYDHLFVERRLIIICAVVGGVLIAMLLRIFDEVKIVEREGEHDHDLEEANAALQAEARDALQAAGKAVYRVADWCVVLPLLCMSALAGHMLIWWVYMGILLVAELVRCCRGLCDETVSQ
ncbi:unnamed protein product [Vitrella brassicaformis CCMP3155]|uniref:Uncharacterized protein n=2 Tax=Vitrella brassicaformis TaxID=1169539 RepID=A0A0G4EM98_VITBC|nr:unnamed protein product [Vitrella brassicaformis CCMP3155]|eukprot:CEL98072.1 unnamed protein product [Vitrella brassicaformis CCMP3155]